jgi:iron complex outermembrane receptor protein
MNVALFKTDTRNELSVLSNNGGRTVYQNVGSTTRKGVELSLDSYWGDGFGSLVSFTYLDARFDEPFKTCTASGCTAANVPVPAGNRIPGIPSQTFYGELNWATDDDAFSTAIEGRYVSRLYANDTNTAYADPYGLMNWRAVLKRKLGGFTLTGFVRVDNLLGEVYAGSVIVNEGSGRFFEAGTPRSFIIGATAGYAF